MTGSRLGPAPQPGLRVLPEEREGAVNVRSPDLARRVAYGAARCMNETHGKEVKVYLTERKKASSFDRWLSYCLGAQAMGLSNGTMSMPESLWYGALAESYFKRQHVVAPAALPTRSDYAASWMSSDADNNIVQQMAACLSETTPQLLNTLFATPPGSVMETNALNELGQYFSPCLAQNATLRTSAAGLRAALALAYFHRLFDIAPQSATEKR